MQEIIGSSELLTKEEREILKSNAQKIKRLCVITTKERALIDMEAGRLKREYSHLLCLTDEARELLREGEKRARAEFEKFIEEWQNPNAHNAAANRQNEKQPQEMALEGKAE